MARVSVPKGRRAVATGGAQRNPWRASCKQGRPARGGGESSDITPSPRWGENQSTHIVHGLRGRSARSTRGYIPAAPPGRSAEGSGWNGREDRPFALPFPPFGRDFLWFGLPFLRVARPILSFVLPFLWFVRPFLAFVRTHGPFGRAFLILARTILILVPAIVKFVLPFLRCVRPFLSFGATNGPFEGTVPRGHACSIAEDVTCAPSATILPPRPSRFLLECSVAARSPDHRDDVPRRTRVGGPGTSPLHQWLRPHRASRQRPSSGVRQDGARLTRVVSLLGFTHRLL